MPERGSGAGWDIRHLFSPPSRAAEGREDPHTEPHAPAHGAPGNPTPITMEDMSDQGGVGSASDPEATLTHPSARDGARFEGMGLSACNGLPPPPCRDGAQAHVRVARVGGGVPRWHKT